MAEKILTFKGMDSWDRPVYEDEAGNLWKDVDPRLNRPAHLCSALNNNFDGEPDLPFHGTAVFVPERVTWNF